MMENKAPANLSPPWYSQQRKISEMLSPDPEITVLDLTPKEGGGYECQILVENPSKAWALEKLLIDRYEFGGGMTVTIHGPSNDTPPINTIKGIFEAALGGNPLFDEFIFIEKGPFGVNYCVLAKKVIQFFNDDLSDYHGNSSCLPTDLARAVFKDTLQVQYCISVKD